MRLFAIPILKNRWAYYCHSKVPTQSRLMRAVNWSSKKWESLGTAEPDTWKRKLHDRGNNLMDQLDYQEWFLKNVPSKEDIEEATPLTQVYHASMVSNTSVQHDLEKLLDERKPYHRKYMFYSAYWVPVACTFAIVPVIPNIPLAYNLFRLYSHYKAYKGAQLLQYLAQHDSLAYAPSPDIDRILQDTDFVIDDQLRIPDEVAEAYAQSQKAQQHAAALQSHIPGTLSPSQIAELAHHFESPGMEVELKRARFQILDAIAREKYSPKNK